jgi:N-acetylmuramoyl-L-alanine amidase
VKFSWILLSSLALSLICGPAYAGQLLSWKYESDKNRLVFQTDDRVQPKAQLIPNPTRLVIDLPGTTLGRPSVSQTYSGAIKSVRVGQFDRDTTRIVIELIPGYTLDPQQIKFKGATPTQWSVTLPIPKRVVQQSLPNNNDSSSNDNSSLPPPTNVNSRDFQITQNGLYIRLNNNTNTKNQDIQVTRSSDRRRIDFDIPDIDLPESLISKNVAVNRYKIGQIQFNRTSSRSTRVSLYVTGDSPDWIASISPYGALIIFPRGGMSAVADGEQYPTATNTNENATDNTDIATIQSVELTNNETQLVIKADRGINGRGTWNSNNGTYEILIANSQLSDRLRGPQLKANSPISQVRIREQDSQNVMVIVQPAPGIQIGKFTQFGENFLLLDLQAYKGGNSPVSVNVPPPETTSSSNNSSTGNPPTNTSPNNTSNRPPKSKILVVIDPGHGGKDPGTIGIDSIQEKDIILPISLQIAQYLEKQGIQVVLTRNSDYFVSLEGRTDMATRVGADLFVSIHANAINLSRPDVSGLETYYFDSGRELANTIHRSILRSVNVRDRGVRRARFYVLRKSTMPSVLVETGYLTGAEDNAKLRNSNYRKQMAEAIARGIIEYIQQNRL